MYSTGITISSSWMGSSRMGVQFLKPFLRHWLEAILNAISRVHVVILPK
jgi:hypothetical protein